MVHAGGYSQIGRCDHGCEHSDALTIGAERSLQPIKEQLRSNFSRAFVRTVQPKLRDTRRLHQR